MHVTQYGLDCTFKIIPKSLKPYKLMIVYTNDNDTEKNILICVICIKYTDYESLLKIFSLPRALYNFSPVTVTSDFALAQTKALKKFYVLLNLKISILILNF